MASNEAGTWTLPWKRLLVGLRRVHTATQLPSLLVEKASSWGKKAEIKVKFEKQWSPDSAYIFLLIAGCISGDDQSFMAPVKNRVEIY